jgi:hypothetical protein
MKKTMTIVATFLFIILSFNLAIADGDGDPLPEKDENHPTRIEEMKKIISFLKENGIEVGKKIDKETFHCPTNYIKGSWTGSCLSSAGSFYVDGVFNGSVSSISVKANIEPTKENLIAMMTPVKPVFDEEESGQTRFSSSDEKFKASGYLRDKYIELNIEFTDDYGEYLRFKSDEKIYSQAGKIKYFKGFNANFLISDKQENLCVSKGEVALMEETIKGPVSQINASMVLGDGAKVIKSEFYCRNNKGNKTKLKTICPDGMIANETGSRSIEKNNKNQTLKAVSELSADCFKKVCPSYSKKVFGYCIYCPNGEFDLKKTNSERFKLDSNTVLCGLNQ